MAGMRLIAGIAVILCAAGAALAQDQSGPMAFTPSFDAQPSAAEMIRLYPSRALQQNISGIAVMCCSPNPDRSVACAISSEFPAGQGFGEAAVQASHLYRLSPQSHADLLARPGTAVRISMLWTGPVILPATLDELRRKDAETMEACLAPSPH
jgi:hypothetical protein